MIATPVEIGSRRPLRRGRIAVVVVAVLSVAIVLIAVPRYLVPPVDSQIEIRENVPFHLPVLSFHAATGGIALLLGPLQFFGSIRRKHPKIHRVIGRTYLLAGVLPAALSGLIVGVLTTSGPITMATFLFLVCIWLYTAWRAYRAVRERHFAEHERWMLRNMAFTFAAVTLRIYLGLFITVQIPLLDPVYGGDFDSLFAVAYTAAVVGSVFLNWAFIELYLRRRPMGAPARP